MNRPLDGFDGLDSPGARDDARLRADLTELLPAPTVPGLTAPRRQALRRTVLTTARSRTARSRTARRTAPFRVGFAVPALAGALAVAVVAVAATGESPVPPGSAATTPAAEPAAGLLARAAHAAAAAPAPVVPPGGYVYIESLVAHAARAADSTGPATPGSPHRRQVWLSADGTQEGLLREEGAPDSPLDVSGPVEVIDHRGATPRPSTMGPGAPSIDRPTHAYVAALPTDPDTLLGLIRDRTRPTGATSGVTPTTTPDGGDPQQRAFTAIGTLLAETWAPPKVTAALFEAAARIPGTTVLPAVRDAAGREGVAVARTGRDGAQTQWIFDRHSSAFLGERTVLTRATAAGPAGTVLGSTAVLTKAAATRPGATPTPPRS
ncbi:CU044_5270 family protein [Streptomyces sp. NPDC090025]|uniref:CU044_5270 family protein n=1 Tax=Streptomyces sp. NPDC090025 TaxID=3365922 RepID=UPI003832CBC6